MNRYRTLFQNLLRVIGLMFLLPASANLLRNGGFEEGESGWMYQQWEGKSLPGHLDRANMSEGLVSFSMTATENQSGKRYMAVETLLENSGEAHVLSFDLKPEELPADSARVRFQLTGKGLWHGPSGKPDLVSIGGSADKWLSYRFVIPAEDLKGVNKVRIFFYHDRIGQGTLSIDNVVLRPAKPEDTTQIPEAPEAEAAAESGESGLVNGGFESGLEGWMYQQWEEKSAPGEVSVEQAPEGRSWFRYHSNGGNVGEYLAKEIALPADDQTYRIQFQLKTDGVPENAARVRLQVPGKGWLHTGEGYPDQIQTGGTAGWKNYSIDLPPEKRGTKGKVILYFYHDKPDTGEIGIDDLQVAPAGQASPATSALPPAEGNLRGLTFHVEQPSVLVPVEKARVAVHATPAQAIYRVGNLPGIDIEWVGAASGVLDWRIVDGFGETIAKGKESAEIAGSTSPALPEGHGYYEIIATLSQDGSVVGEARRSLGALRPAPPTDGDEPFGLWIQGRKLYPELGVRWVREGIYYGSFAGDPEGFTKGMRDLFAFYQENDIKILAYPKGQPTEFKIDRELMKDTPEAWAALEAHWTAVVTSFAEQVDAWGVINEPMADFWTGTDDMIIRYWALMRKIVDEHDPGAPVIGPSVNPMTPRHIRQWEDLLKMGIADSLDGIEVHPYTLAPEDNQLLAATNRFQTMAEEIADKQMEVWVTELGVSASYSRELWQADFLMRSWLLAKEANYPMMIWHMFSWPQGESQREVDFGIWRNDKAQKEPPQPRPAGLAYGVMTRQLAGATFKNRLEYFGPSVRAYVFERRGKPMLAIWTTGPKDLNVQISATGEKVESVNIFGRRQELPVENGLVSVKVQPSPLFISPVPAYLLNARPLVESPETVIAVPGEWTRTRVSLSHPLESSADLRVEWLTPAGWTLEAGDTSWTLDAGETASATLSLRPPLSAELGPHPVYGKVFLNGDYVASAAIPLRIDAPVTLVDLKPVLTPKPGVRVVLRRMNPEIAAVEVSMADSDVSVPLSLEGEEDIKEVILPVEPAPVGELKSITVRAEAREITSTRSENLSFVTADYFSEAPEIDGSLDDWPELTPFQLKEGDEPMAVAWGWDQKHLYLAVRVTDAVHLQEQEPFATWQQDGMQIGLVPYRNDALVRPPNPGLQESDYTEIDTALREEGPSVYRHRTLNKHLASEGSVPADSLPRAIVRDGVQTIYEMAFPLPALGIKSLEAGDVMRAALLVNDADEEGGGIERATRSWFNGIRKSKDPRYFGHVILRAPEQ